MQASGRLREVFRLTLVEQGDYRVHACFARAMPWWIPNH